MLRDVGAHAVLSVGLFAAANIIPDSAASIVMIVLAPLFVALFVVLASATDRGVRGWPAIVAARRGLGRVVLSASLMLAGFGFMGAIFAFINHVRPAQSQPDRFDITQFALAASAESTQLAMWFAVPLFTLGLPMLTLSGVGLGAGWKIALAAYRKNGFIKFLTLGVAVAILAGMLLTAGFSAIAFYPVTGAMMYVAYRDVFLGVPPGRVAVALAATESA